MWWLINTEAGNFPSYDKKNSVKDRNRYSNKSAKVTEM
jgi:GH18 family chitinase